MPKQQFSVAATYRMDFVPEHIAKPVFSINYAWRSVQKGSTLQGVGGVPAFGVANARLAFENVGGSPATVAFWVQNLADKAYRFRCTDNLNSLGYETCAWGDPRTYGVTLSADF